jgi:hypothetical protein
VQALGRPVSYHRGPMKVRFACTDCAGKVYEIPASQVDLVRCLEAHRCDGWALATCPKGHAMNAGFEGARIDDEPMPGARAALLSAGARLADGQLSHEVVIWTSLGAPL